MDRRRKEALASAQETLAKRQADDPLRNFPLHPKQKAFCDSVLLRLFDENWFIAANRAGKSEAGSFCGASLARFGREDAKWVSAQGSDVSVRDRSTSGWVSALDFPTSRDVIQPKYFNNGYAKSGSRPPFIPDHEIEKWDTEAQILKLKNGSIIGFKSAESGRRKYQGADKDWIHFDEEHPREIYEEAVIRVGAHPLIFFCTATILPPEGMAAATISWVFPLVISPWKEGNLPGVGLFGASIYDNPGIARSEIKRLESIYPENSLSRRIRLQGEWLPGIGGSRAYTSFDRMLHVAREPMILMPHRPLVWMWDFNVEPMISLVGQQDRYLYKIYKEIILDEGSIAEMCDMFRHHYPEHLAEIWLYGDSTGEGRSNQTGQTNYWTILNEMKQYGSPIRLRIPSENPRVPDRINAVNRILKDEEGLVRLQVDPGCKELIADLEGVLRDQRGGILKVRNRKDPYFRRTHTSDGLGYWLAFEEPVRPEKPRGGKSSLPSNVMKGPSYGRGT